MIEFIPLPFTLFLLYFKVLFSVATRRLVYAAERRNEPPQHFLNTSVIFFKKKLSLANWSSRGNSEHVLADSFGGDAQTNMIHSK